jgi:hypothetical protein
VAAIGGESSRQAILRAARRSWANPHTPHHPAAHLSSLPREASGKSHTARGDRTLLLQRFTLLLQRFTRLTFHRRRTPFHHHHSIIVTARRDENADTANDALFVTVAEG